MAIDLSSSCAWVLHKRLSGETSAWVTFFTYESGLMTALFKGGRRPKNAALLQPFTPLCLLYETKREWHYVRQLELLAAPQVLTGEALFAGLYVNELIFHMLSENEPAPALFEQFARLLEQLAHSPTRLETAIILRGFERALLHHCGYELSLTHDSHGRAIDAQSHYRYTPGEGLHRHHSGFSSEILHSIANEAWQGAGVVSAARQLFQQALDHALAGRVIRSRGLYAAYLREQAVN